MVGETAVVTHRRVRVLGAPMFGADLIEAAGEPPSADGQPAQWFVN